MIREKLTYLTYLNTGSVKSNEAPKSCKSFHCLKTSFVSIAFAISRRYFKPIVINLSPVDIDPHPFIVRLSVFDQSTLRTGFT